jgi:hypothetical protein
MYVGDGKENPSVATRLALLEDVVSKLSKNSSRIVWLLVGLVITLIIDICTGKTKVP